MNSYFRTMPRYIRNTDAFGWQGADHQNGPWRSIPAPQIGTPWQTLDAAPRRVLDHLAAEIIAAQQLQQRQLTGDEICRMLLEDYPTETIWREPFRQEH